MMVIESKYEILDSISEGGIKELQKIEMAARTCYKSEDKITADGESAKRLVAGLISSGHEAMLEHGGLTVKFFCDRGVSHELVRHRMASFAQESTRYCNYTKDKFGNGITFIYPDYDFTSEQFLEWTKCLEICEKTYNDLVSSGVSPQIARSVLPNATKTEVVVTANWREWRHILDLRADKTAHPDIRKLMLELLEELHKRIPVLFDDIYVMKMAGV